MAGGRARRTAGLATLGALALAVGTVALAVGPAPLPAAAAALTNFRDCQAVDDWFSDQVRNQVATGPVPQLEASAAQDSSGAGGTQSAVGNGETGTNLQEAGVDEPDVVKLTRGLLITVQSGTVLVVDVNSDTPRTRGTLALPAGIEHADLLVVGDRVVAIAQPMTLAQPVDLDMLMPAGGTTWIGVIDLSDPSAPALVSASETEGRLVDARLTGDTVRVVTTYQPGLAVPEPATVQGPGPGVDYLPHLVTRGNGGVDRIGPAVACTALAHPGEHAGAEVTTVSSIVPGTVTAGADPVGERTAVAAPGNLVYASPNGLYLATHSTSPGSDRTEVHAFGTTTSGTTGYLASGAVDGTVIGRWAFSERDGVLRVATTRTTDTRAPGFTGDGVVRSPDVLLPPQDTFAPTMPPTDSAVTILRRSGNALTTVGQVTGLGRGERIQAVRWFDDVAYVVTFRQVDPLYVVDLSDPTNPRVTGELKIPGFSSYLHPLGADRLLGVGTAATPDGMITGLQVSTFDVSDPAEPTLLDSYTRAGSTSPVAADSRLFSYLPQSQLAIVPTADELAANVVLAIRVDGDGTLEVTARDLVPNDRRSSYAYLQRVVPVGSDRLAALVTDHDPVTGDPSARLLMLDHGLTVKGTAGLG